ncbi:VanZ family protein [Streptomyces sp. DSM 41527]|uniref:VanZ family protein n=1 Tax=Streptomyces mooreae TaxID=3075523 RepID=A0ABU2TGW6_9ACTN|nr:VanZ family protein [Streptomyces sp. DSM 41527]MDT0460135.1 VanZ family protein [Streptomyces sp. DSM 41527]
MQPHGPGTTAAPRMRVTGLLLLVAHLLTVAWLTLRPRTVPWVPAANLEPLATIRAELARGWSWEAAQHLGGSVLLLAPLGVLLPLSAGRLNVSPLVSLTRTAFAGAMIALAIELLQSGVPGRVPDIDSVLLGTLGVAVVHLAVVPAARRRLRRRYGPLGGTTPTIPRVGLAPKADALSGGRTYL